MAKRDVTLDKDHPKELLIDKHISYLRKYAQDKDSPEQLAAEHLRVCGLYWGINALDLMGQLPTDEKEIEGITLFISKCQHKDGGFGGGIGQDPNLIPTLSAIQVLVIFNRCREPYIKIDACVNYIKSLQELPEGFFYGDKWKEIDNRFIFCALAATKLLGRLKDINVDAAVEYLSGCQNDIDGGFGSKAGGESHAAYVYCCVGSLAIADRLDVIKKDRLGSWLSERQLPSGGLNGRPEKLPDLCYTWWCLSSLSMIDRLKWLNHSKLLDFVFACQDPEHGGFSDRPGNWVDPYHTVFGLAGISLLVHGKHSGLKKKIKEIDPVFCMASERIKSISQSGLQQSSS